MGTFTRKAALLLFAGLVFIGCAHTEIDAGGGCGNVTISGLLEKVKGAPAETSGWAVLLDNNLRVGGREFSSVEVFTSKDLTPFQGKKVEAIGCVSNVKELANGQHPAFVPKSVELKKKKFLIF